jgi:deoxyadenosine/deoxycytidine kinase
MAVIAIVGTSGVGKSFLVKQLASLENVPAFLEGEEGIIPKEVFAEVWEKKNPAKNWNWFMTRNKIQLERARKISDAGIDCFIDCTPEIYEAFLADESKDQHPALLKLIESASHLKSDKIIILTANEKKLRELIVQRDRKAEEPGKTTERSLRIQEAFLRIANREKDFVVIDRTDLDFTKEEDLRAVRDRILKD